MKRNAAIVALTLLAWGFGLNVQYDESFIGAFAHKVDLSQNTPGRRICFQF